MRVRAAMKKLLIIFNILLASIFAYRLFALHADLGYETKDTNSILKYNVVQRKRPSFNGVMKYRDIFAAKASGGTASEFSRPTDLDSDLKRQDELVAGNRVLRVRGIFIWDTGRYAIISVTGNKQKQEKEWRKVAVGDQISGFTIHSIRPDIVMLEAPSSEIIRLRIFKRSSRINDKRRSSNA